MFDFIDTILYFILTVILILIILHNFSKVYNPIYEGLRRRGKKSRKKQKQKATLEEETPEQEILEEENVEDIDLDDDDDDDYEPIPTYSAPVNENTIDNMKAELDKEVVLEPNEMETIDEDDE